MACFMLCKATVSWEKLYDTVSRAPVQAADTVINIINMRKAHVETQQYMLQ